MLAELTRRIEGKWVIHYAYHTRLRLTRKKLKEIWADMNDSDVLIITGGNPKTYEESLRTEVYKVIHQIDNKKFTVEQVTVIRKDGELVLRNGKVEWEGFDIFRDVILQIVTLDEAIKIIESWKPY